MRHLRGARKLRGGMEDRRGKGRGGGGGGGGEGGEAIVIHQCQ